MPRVTQFTPHSIEKSKKKVHHEIIGKNTFFQQSNFLCFSFFLFFFILKFFYFLKFLNSKKDFFLKKNKKLKNIFFNQTNSFVKINEELKTNYFLYYQMTIKKICKTFRFLFKIYFLPENPKSQKATPYLFQI